MMVWGTMIVRTSYENLGTSFVTADCDTTWRCLGGEYCCTTAGFKV